MAPQISPIARFAPGTVVVVMDIVRQFIKPLPAPGEYTVREMRLRKEGWLVVLEEFPDQEYRDITFEPVCIVPLGEEQPVPGLEEELERLSKQFTLPPGFEDFHFGLPDQRFAHG